jgi:uncharacterized membrane protein YphA (DoxX/SURF4 family)
MMNPKYRRYSILAIRIILGIVFLISGVGKLVNGADARYLVELLATEYFWLIEYSAAIVIATSILEIILAAFLLWGSYLKTTLSITFLMLIGFSSVLGYFYLQGMSVESCGCFGAFGIGGGLEATLLRNFVLLALITGAYLLMTPKTATP